MKRFIAGLLTASMLVTTPIAFADDRDRGHDRNGGWKNGHGWNGGHGHYQKHRYSKSYGHHKNNDNHDDTVWYLLGGLLVGGLVTHGIHQSRATPVSVPVEPYPPAPGRRLLRDLEGRCYEVGIDAAGYEVRSELPSSACNW